MKSVAYCHYSLLVKMQYFTAGIVLEVRQINPIFRMQITPLHLSSPFGWFGFLWLPLLILYNVNKAVSASLGDVTCAVQSTTSVAGWILPYKAYNRQHISPTDTLFILQLSACPWCDKDMKTDKQKMDFRASMFGLSKSNYPLLTVIFKGLHHCISHGCWESSWTHHSYFNIIPLTNISMLGSAG